MYSHDITGLGLDFRKPTMQLRRLSMLDVNLSVTWSLRYNFGFQVTQSNTTALTSAERSCQERCNSITLDFRHNILLHLWHSVFCLCWSNQAAVQISLLPVDDVSPRGLPQHILRECSWEEKLEMVIKSSLGDACLLNTLRHEGNSCLVLSYTEK